MLQVMLLSVKHVEHTQGVQQILERSQKKGTLCTDKSRSLNSTFEITLVYLLSYYAQ